MQLFILTTPSALVENEFLFNAIEVKENGFFIDVKIISSILGSCSK